MPQAAATPVIAPRRTRLVEVTDLPAFQRAVAALSSLSDPWSARETAVIVANRAAAGMLRRTLENQRLDGAGAIVLPHLLTRDDWYVAMHGHLKDPPPRLSALEREVLVGRSARAAVAAGFPPPFRLHPGLLAEIAAFYDELRAHRRTVDAFERLVLEDLAPRAETDRGADRLLRQTRFLVALFRAYEAALAESGVVDEAALRALLLEHRGGSPFQRLVVTVGDRVAQRGGLWPADFDLITRLHGLDAVDIVATGRALAAGLSDRLSEALPGIEREQWGGHAAPRLRTLVAPRAEGGRLYWTSRDREEELVDIARWLKRERMQPIRLKRDPTADAGERADETRQKLGPTDQPEEGVDQAWLRPGCRADSAEPATAIGEIPLDRAAVVFQRPLPYVYLAQAVFDSACIRHQISDALPLASEPYAAAVDLVFAFLASRFARRETIALLGSPHFVFAPGGEPLSPSMLEPVARFLKDAGVEGGDAWIRLGAEGLPPEVLARPGSPSSLPGHLETVLKAAAGLAAELEPLTRSRPASQQFELLFSFLTGHHRPSQPEAAIEEGQLGARAAVLGALAELGAAHARYDDAPCTIGPLASRVRRWMESQTFTPRRGPGGLQVVDADAARYGDFDEAWLVGVIEGEWPERPSANVFYPPFLLSQLGWPAARAAAEAARAAFDDLVRLPHRHTFLSAFTLEDDAIVEPSALLEELDLAGVEVVRADPPPRLRVSAEDALWVDPPRLDVLAPGIASWARSRRERGPRDEPRFQGQADPAGRGVYTVTALEEYLKCPFKYFAHHVLRLPDETEGEAALAPRLQGLILHQVLHDFFDSWQQAGRGAITLETLPDARECFRAAAVEALDRLPPEDAVAVRIRLLGSPFSPGAGEIVARAEIERRVPVVARLLEFRLDGSCTLETGRESRTLRLRGVADRIDLTADGALHVIDYKLGRPPGPRYAVQLPVYAVHARQALEGHLGRSWSIGDASYVSLSGRDAVLSLGAQPQGLEDALKEGQARALAAVDGIERGAFPPRPADTSLCRSCPYTTVCRKEYAADDEPAPSV